MTIGFLAGRGLALAATVLPSTQAIWAVVDRPKIEQYGALHHPQIVALPDGTLIAAVGRSVHWSDEGTNLYRSTDRGESWLTVRAGFPLSDGQLFPAGRDVVLIGVNCGGRAGGGEARICRSSDGGVTWSGASSMTKDSF